jgi:hypothetical protein
MGQKQNADRDFLGSPKGKRPVETHRRKWDDIIKMDVGVIRVQRGGINWTDERRGPVSTVINLRIL